MSECALKRSSIIYTDLHNTLSYKILLMIKSKPTKLFAQPNNFQDILNIFNMLLFYMIWYLATYRKPFLFHKVLSGGKIISTITIKIANA